MKHTDNVYEVPTLEIVLFDGCDCLQDSQDFDGDSNGVGLPEIGFGF